MFDKNRQEKINLVTKPFGLRFFVSSVEYYRDSRNCS